MLTIMDLARNRPQYLPGEAVYDHALQRLVGTAIDAPQTTTWSDEDAGGSTTFWDGERS